MIEMEIRSWNILFETFVKFKVSKKHFTKKNYKSFYNKGKKQVPSSKTNWIDCTYKDDKIGGTEGNVVTRWGDNTAHSWEPAQFIKNKLHHNFNSCVVANPSRNKNTSKKLEAIFIVLKKTKLNEQVRDN